MSKTIYEPISSEDDRPATKADVTQILMAIETLSEQMNYKSGNTL